MSQLSKAYEAINLSQGFPAFDLDPKPIDIIKVTAPQKVIRFCFTKEGKALINATKILCKI